MKSIFDMNPTTPFGEWLLVCMIEYEMSCGDVAKKLHCTRQVVARHVNTGKVTYVWCIAYAQLFNYDPDLLWKKVNEA